MKLYGKDKLKKILDNIAKQGRIPHAVLFSGHSGCGKKELARYTAQLLLCGSGACGECAVCRNIEHDAHPDVIFVKRACGEKYSIDPFREVLKSTVVLPNNGDLKIYVFEDCDSMPAQLHNTLLKLIEEPAAHLRFIFTCENTGLVPETVLSRVTEFEVPDTSVGDCTQCLIDSGTEPERARELSEMYSGNIGKCRDVLNGGDESGTVASAVKAAAAIGRRDSYGFAAALCEQTGRAEFSLVREHLSNILRDALALSIGGKAESFGKKEAKKIAETSSEPEIMHMLDVIFEIGKNEIYNLNLALTGAYITSQIFNN